LELNSLLETSSLEDVQLYATLKIIESVHLTGSLFSDTAANLIYFHTQKESYLGKGNQRVVFRLPKSQRICCLISEWSSGCQRV